MTIEAELCAGCRNCELACSFSKTGAYSPSNSRITVAKDDASGMDYPVLCHQCATCPASVACTSGAFGRTAAGIVEVDEGTCVGCGACARACAYGAVKMRGGTTIVCDLCGGEPVCVLKCPTGALVYGESDKKPATPEEAHAALRRRWGIHD